jgi:hydrogenase maturation protease
MNAEPGMPSPAPVLVLAVGNPSRGDDAVGPLLAEWLAERALPGVEVLVDYQLQVEHALDLVRRERVLFVDACVDADAPAVVRRVVPDEHFAHTSHALEPAQVLGTYRRITGREAPESWLVAIRGERFELGAKLSGVAERGCEAARLLLLELCAR